MTYQHKNLAQGRWSQLPLIEQMVNIGSEVERALNWREKNNAVYCQQAFGRALELIDLTLGNLKTFPQLKELARARESLVDSFFGDNQFMSSEKSLRKYFSCFTYAVRKNY